MTPKETGEGWAARTPSERSKLYASLRGACRAAADALRAEDPAEAQQLGLIARQFGGAIGEVVAKYDKATPCCWEASAFGVCECGR